MTTAVCGLAVLTSVNELTVCTPVQGAHPEQAEDCAGSCLVSIPAQPQGGAGLPGNSCPDQGELCSCGTPLALGWPPLYCCLACTLQPPTLSAHVISLAHLV